MLMAPFFHPEPVSMERVHGACVHGPAQTPTGLERQRDGDASPNATAAAIGTQTSALHPWHASLQIRVSLEQE